MPFLKVQDQITYIQLQHCPASKLVPCRLRRYELENQAYSCSGSPVVVKGEPLQGTRKTRNWAKKEFTRQKCRRRQITSNHITYSTVSSASNLQHFNEPRPYRISFATWRDAVATPRSSSRAGSLDTRCIACASALWRLPQPRDKITAPRWGLSDEQSWKSPTGSPSTFMDVYI